MTSEVVMNGSHIRTNYEETGAQYGCQSFRPLFYGKGLGVVKGVKVDLLVKRTKSSNVTNSNMV